MAKIVYPPMFTKLEEFFDLLLTPQKYASYVQQLKDLHAAVGERLEALDSKQKADEYLSKAASLLEQATKEAAQTANASQQAKQEATRLMAEAQAKQTALATKQAAFDQECRSKQEALAKRELEVEHALSNLKARYAALEAEEVAFRQDKHNLQLEQEKARKAIETLKSYAG